MFHYSFSFFLTHKKEKKGNMAEQNWREMRVGEIKNRINDEKRRKKRRIVDLCRGEWRKRRV